MLANLLLSFLSFIIAGYFIFVSMGMKTGTVLAENSVFFPLSVAIILLCLGLVQLGNTLSAHQKAALSIGISGDIYRFFGLLLAYLVVLPFAGYLISSVLFCVFYTIIYQIYRSRSSLLTIALALPVSVWMVFRFLLKVALP